MKCKSVSREMRILPKLFMKHKTKIHIIAITIGWDLFVPNAMLPPPKKKKKQEK